MGLVILPKKASASRTAEIAADSSAALMTSIGAAASMIFASRSVSTGGWMTSFMAGPARHRKRRHYRMVRYQIALMAARTKDVPMKSQPRVELGLLGVRRMVGSLFDR